MRAIVGGSTDAVVIRSLSKQFQIPIKNNEPFPIYTA